MKKIILYFCVVIFIVSLCCISCSAEVYSEYYPSYVPVSGGAYAEVVTPEGDACFVVANNYRNDVFGFQGSAGYNIANITSSTVNGNIYFKDATSYYGNPKSLQCRFSSFDTLNVYVPYQNNYGGTSYQWQPLNISEILNTNIAFTDTSSDRYNNQYLYSPEFKLLCVILVVCIGILLTFPLRRGWRA